MIGSPTCRRLTKNYGQGMVFVVRSVLAMLTFRYNLTCHFVFIFLPPQPPRWILPPQPPRWKTICLGSLWAPLMTVCYRLVNCMEMKDAVLATIANNGNEVQEHKVKYDVYAIKIRVSWSLCVRCWFDSLLICNLLWLWKGIILLVGHLSYGLLLVGWYAQMYCHAAS